MPMLPNHRFHTRWFSHGAEKLAITAYVRRDNFGRGPSFSVNRKTIELARYDLFADSAHHHRRDEPGQPRHYYPPGLALAEYVELAIADMVRDFPVPDGAADWVRKQIPELAALAATP